MAHIRILICLMTVSGLLRTSDATGASTVTTDSSTVTMVTGDPTTSTTASRCNNITPVSKNDTENHLRILEMEFKPDAAGYRRALDLAFIVDRSQSTGSKALTLTKRVITSLLNKLSELQYIFIHRDYTRVAVVSFAGQATADINGISPASQAVDACILTERIDELQVNKSFTSKSYVGKAMSRVMDMLATSKASTYRPDPDQLVWMFFDGECNPDTPLQCMYNGTHINEWAKEMRRVNIRVFTAGIGEWLNSDEKERQLQNLAFDNDHYACATLWEDIIPDLSGQKNENPQAPLFNEIAEVYKSRCGPCPTGFECACDVISRTYNCTDEVVVPLTPTQKPDWLLPVAIGSSVGGLILLLILLVALPVVACKRRRDRQEDERFFRNQPKYIGPTLPPPPVRRRIPRRIVDPPRGYVNIHSDVVTGLNSEQADTADQDDSLDYEDVSSLQDYVNTDTLDHAMRGWPGQLAYIAQSYSLKHMAACSISNNRWAKTAGSPVTERDFREMEKIMRTARSNPTNHKLKIGSKFYDVDSAKLAKTQIHASRFIHEGPKEVVWISKACDYVIVGIADSNADENCENAVHDIHMHLMRYFESNMSNITGDLIEDGAYVMVSRNASVGQ